MSKQSPENPWKNRDEGRTLRGIPFVWDREKSREKLQSGEPPLEVEGVPPGPAAPGEPGAPAEPLPATGSHRVVTKDDLLDEFKIAKIVDFKRVRAAIEHENTLTNHRLTWLFASHTFLFGAFGLVLTNSFPPQDPGHRDVVGQLLPGRLVPLLAVSTIGVFVCLFIGASAWCATAQIFRLEAWWHAHYVLKRSDLEHYETADLALDRVRNDLLDYDFRTSIHKDHPPVNGIFRHWFNRLFAAHHMPWFLGVVWIALGTTGIELSYEPSSRHVPTWLPKPLQGFGFVVFGSLLAVLLILWLALDWHSTRKLRQRVAAAGSPEPARPVS